MMLTGMQQGYQGQGGYTQYQDQYARGAPAGMGQDFNQQYPPSTTYPPNRPMYPPYGPEGDRWGLRACSKQSNVYDWIVCSLAVGSFFASLHSHCWHGQYCGVLVSMTFWSVAAS